MLGTPVTALIRQGVFAVMRPRSHLAVGQGMAAMGETKAELFEGFADGPGYRSLPELRQTSVSPS